MTERAPARGVHFQQHIVRTPAVPIHYAEVPSEGPPLVALHGIGMDWRVWQAISRRLWPDFHLYLLDLRGHGESGKPARGYSVADYAADVEDVIDQLGLVGVTLLGSSLGGMVALSVEVPEDIVPYRVLVDPPLTGGPVRDPEMLATILRLKHEPVPVLAEYLGQYNPGAGKFYLRTMSEMWHEAADGVIEEVLAHRGDYFDVASALRNNPSRTLIMRANPELGGALTEEQAQQTLAQLPHGSMVGFEEPGHAIHAYRPAEFARMVLEFTGIEAKTLAGAGGG